MEKTFKTKEFSLPEFLQSFSEEDCTSLLNRVVDNNTSFFHKLIGQETEVNTDEVFVTSGIVTERVPARSERHIRIDNLLVVCLKLDEESVDIPTFVKGMIPIIVKGKYNYTDFDRYDQLRIMQVTGKQSEEVYYFAFIHFTYERYIH